MTNDITPTLDRLRGEKTHYLKWAANDAEEQRLQKFCVAYNFTQAEFQLKSSDGERLELEEHQAELQAEQKKASVIDWVDLLILLVWSVDWVIDKNID